MWFGHVFSIGVGKTIVLKISFPPEDRIFLQLWDFNKLNLMALMITEFVRNLSNHVLPI